jgi:hypothetical protein
MICCRRVTYNFEGQPMYRIREVDGQDGETARQLAELHRRTFLEAAPVPKFDQGYWWLAYDRLAPVGFAGLIHSAYHPDAGYFCRVGVTAKHRGNCLQLRFMRALEVRARRSGWNSIISDTTDNVASANNFIAGGYRLYRPKTAWAWPHSLYWKKMLE